MAIQIEHPNARGMAATLNAALAAGKRVHLRYYVPSRDEATERDVDPMRLLVVEGRTYLEGWCRRAEGVRLFRLDRVLSVDVLDVPAEVPETAEPVDVDAGLFRRRRRTCSSSSSSARPRAGSPSTTRASR